MDAEFEQIVSEANAIIRADILYREHNRSALVVGNRGGCDFVENGEQVEQSDPLFEVFATTMARLEKAHGIVREKH